VKCSWMRGGWRARRGPWGACGWRSCRTPVAAAGVGRRGHLLEEPQEFLVAVAGSASVDDAPGRDLQRGEQGGGAMSGVIVGALLGASRPHVAHGLGALQGLDLGLLIDAQHDRAVGWVRVEPDDVVDLGCQFRVGGELERLGAPGLDAVLAPDPGDGVAADTELAGQQPGRPVGDPQPGRWWGKGDCQDLGPAEPTDRLWSSRPGPVGEPIQPAAHVAARQAITVGRETPTRRAISVLATPSAPGAGCGRAGRARLAAGRSVPICAARPGHHG
jgi:hypothetical protein